MYLLGEGIYPEWSLSVKPINEPHDSDGVRYKQKQDDVRKDSKRALGVLQSSFKIIHREQRSEVKYTGHS